VRRSFFLLIFPIFLFTFSAGCQTHDCDSSASDGGTGALRVIGGQLAWENVSELGNWQDFPGEATITYTFPASFRPANYDIFPYVSTGPQQGANGGTSTSGGGQPVEYTNVSPTGFSITNATCAEYYLHVVVMVVQDAGAIAPDASRD